MSFATHLCAAATKSKHAMRAAGASIWQRWHAEWREFVADRRAAVRTPIFWLAILLSTFPLLAIALQHARDPAWYQVFCGMLLMFCMLAWFVGLAYIAAADAIVGNVPLLGDAADYADMADGIGSQKLRNLHAKKREYEGWLHGLLMRIFGKLIGYGISWKRKMLKIAREACQWRNLTLSTWWYPLWFLNAAYAGVVFVFMLIGLVGALAFLPHMKISLARLPILACAVAAAFAFIYPLAAFGGSGAWVYPTVWALVMCWYVVFFVSENELTIIQKHIKKYLLSQLT